MTDDMQLANDLSQKAMQLRDVSRFHWKNASDSLREMGNAITEMNQVYSELAVVLKRIKK